MTPLDAAYNVVHDYPGGAEALAHRIGKKPVTLCQEVRPPVGGSAKFALVDAVKVTNLTGDARIVYAFNEACGFCTPLPLPTSCATDGSMQELLERGCDLSRQVAEIFREFQSDIADGKVTPNELAAFERHALETIASVISLTKTMRVRAESDQAASRLSITRTAA